jgi:hypothetical protein
MIEAKEAVEIAEKFIQAIMPNFGTPKLEEIERFGETDYDAGIWILTFSRDSDLKPGSLEELLRRSELIKVVRVSASDGRIISIKNRAA